MIGHCIIGVPISLLFSLLNRNPQCLLLELFVQTIATLLIVLQHGQGRFLSYCVSVFAIGIFKEIKAEVEDRRWLILLSGWEFNCDLEMWVYFLKRIPQPRSWTTLVSKLVGRIRLNQLVNLKSEGTMFSIKYNECQRNAVNQWTATGVRPSAKPWLTQRDKKIFVS